MTTIEDKRRLIEARIAELTSTLLQLKIQHNELAPISKLPPEILARTFDFALNTINRRCKRAARSQSFEPRTCLNFTHVSQHWRSVALNTPYLWRKLPFACEKWTEVMLERSRMSSLVIELDCVSCLGRYSDRKATLSRIKKVLTEHADRIREINLLGISTFQLKPLLDDIPDSSFRLTSLVLTTNTFTEYTIPVNILSGLDRLRQLHVRNYHFPWYSQQLCGLTHLRVENHTPPLPMSSFVAALRTMPALQVLHMKNSLPQTSDISHVKPLNLANLQDLDLSEINLGGLSDVLSIIGVPEQAKISLLCEDDDLGEDDIARFASSLSTFFSLMGSEESKRPSYRKLDVILGDFWDLQLSFRRGGREDAVLDVNFPLVVFVQDDSLLKVLLSSMPLHHLSSLSLSFPLCSETLIDVFGKLQQLQLVEIYGDCVVGFVKAMRSVDKTRESRPYKLAFPSLHTLAITEATFSSSEPTGIDLNSLESCLAKRKKHNGKLKKLKLFSCYYISDSDVQSLQQLVDDVEWDGRELTYEETDCEW